jgi:hypothetical protein
MYIQSIAVALCSLAAPLLLTPRRSKHALRIQLSLVLSPLAVPRHVPPCCPSPRFAAEPGADAAAGPALLQALRGPTSHDAHGLRPSCRA